MSRHSLHQDPIGATAIARHYIRDIVYGANDGLITTFAVVSGVAGGSLSTLAVVVVGAANLVADGISMGVGTFSRSARTSARARQPRCRSRKHFRRSTRWPRWWRLWWLVRFRSARM
jgi:VIT1/CCC1 family predicted Fe2+/Mn2+ transporter